MVIFLSHQNTTMLAVHSRKSKQIQDLNALEELENEVMKRENERGRERERKKNKHTPVITYSQITAIFADKAPILGSFFLVNYLLFLLPFPFHQR